MRSIDDCRTSAARVHALAQGAGVLMDEVPESRADDAIAAIIDVIRELSADLAEDLGRLSGVAVR